MYIHCFIDLLPCMDLITTLLATWVRAYPHSGSISLHYLYPFTVFLFIWLIFNNDCIYAILVQFYRSWASNPERDGCVVTHEPCLDRQRFLLIFMLYYVAGFHWHLIWQFAILSGCFRWFYVMIDHNIHSCRFPFNAMHHDAWYFFMLVCLKREAKSIHSGSRRRYWI